ncbi:glycosyltransferase family 4 protein [Olivibacter sp. XZL3]|uniref:glycosyltransferase family 4 protein n=1 Tax=Olivibacter sp. XZL3 TaxID=1735116 RepID=UPI001065FCB8|nr:glycosyltransferase family 4 protein [Olivibacter sp. XZL3]
MKIAQVSPLFESVPPKLYGGTERVVSYLTEALVNQGHDVTLFASGDSITRAKLISHTSEALRLNPQVIDPLAFHTLQLQEVIERAHEFDIIHFHTDYFHFPASQLLQKPCVTTLHGRLDIPELKPLYQKFNTQPVISISNSQRSPLPHAAWLDTVYHGLPKNLYKVTAQKEDYVAFIGRISPEKRPDRAIEIAEKAGCKIKIAAKIDKADAQYFNKHIKHLFQKPHVEYIGEIGEQEKNEFLGKARALLFPIDWPEPFGMVMIEAMACGTPVIAYAHGSVSEIIQHGKNGFIVSSTAAASKAIEDAAALDPQAIRRLFEERFSADTMAQNYIKNYELLKNRNRIPSGEQPSEFLSLNNKLTA